MFKVVRIFNFPGALDIEKKVFNNQVEINVIPSATEKEIIANCQYADAIICSYEPLTKTVIEALPNLKLIACGTIGYNYIDIKYAGERNIIVTNIFQYCIKEVADYTVSMILMLNRRLLQFHDSVRINKHWKFNLFPDIRRLESQTIGLLGFGNISREVAKRLKPFGPKIIAYDPFVDEKQVKLDYDVDLLSFNDILEQSDIISIHLPANKETEQLISDKNIAKMNDGVILINSARGQVVDEEAILRAVNSNKLKFYAADVLNEETPDIKSHPFNNKENIILTPHIAFYSQESIKEGAIEWAYNVENFVNGNYQKCNIVNNEYLTNL